MQKSLGYRQIFLLLLLIISLSLIFAQEFTFSSSQWFVTNGEGPKNCGVSTSNVSDGWNAPQNICTTDNSFSQHSSGENYIGAVMNFAQIEQSISCYSRVNSIKVKFNYKNSNANSNIFAGALIGSNYYPTSFKLPSQSTVAEKIVDITSLKTWTTADAILTKPIVKSSPGSDSFQIDSIFLIVDFEKKIEVCNGVDDDCDGEIDEGVKNACGGCGTVPDEVCNGSDDDCDGEIDETFSCIKNSIGCTDTCSFATRMTQKCLGSIPQNAKQNFGSTDGNFTQSYDGTNWVPSSKSMHHNTVVEECAWVCESSYHFNSSTNQCESNILVSSCVGQKNASGIWNDNGQNGVYSYTGTNPGKITHYSEIAEDCAWKCSQTTHFDLDTNTCVLNERLASCEGTLPQNAKWVKLQNLGKFTQTWVNLSWSPSSKNSFYSENSEECAYGCLNQQRECTYSPENFCGKGKQDCNKGDWGECVADYGNVCSQNQYCLNDACVFCSSGTKNCDLNLFTGCETNVNNNSKNCGSCGVSCDTNQICSLGVCVSITSDQNQPVQTTCGSNSTFNSTTGACVCQTGFNNCNGSESDGCEKEGLCNQSPPDIIDNTFCDYDYECETNEQCINSVCTQTSVMCSTNSGCENDSYCLNGECIKVECKNNFSIINHECVCSGKICGNECKNEEGICCKGFWNPKITSCEINYEEILLFVNNSNDLQAIELVDSAIDSIEKGNILKARGELAVSHLKAKISNLNDSNYIGQYNLALNALESKDYLLAEEISNNAIQTIPKEDNFFVFLIVGIVIILIIAVAFWMKTHPKIIEEE